MSLDLEARKPGGRELPGSRKIEARISDDRGAMGRNTRDLPHEVFCVPRMCMPEKLSDLLRGIIEEAANTPTTKKLWPT